MEFLHQFVTDFNCFIRDMRSLSLGTQIWARMFLFLNLCSALARGILLDGDWLAQNISIVEPSVLSLLHTSIKRLHSPNWWDQSCMHACIPCYCFILKHLFIKYMGYPEDCCQLDICCCRNTGISIYILNGSYLENYERKLWEDIMTNNETPWHDFQFHDNAELRITH